MSGPGGRGRDSSRHPRGPCSGPGRTPRLSQSFLSASLRGAIGQAREVTREAPLFGSVALVAAAKPLWPHTVTRAGSRVPGVGGLGRPFGSAHVSGNKRLGFGFTC